MSYLPDRDAEGRAIYTTSPFADASGYRARLKGVSGVAIAGQPTNLDFVIAEERSVNGIRLLLENHQFSDTLNFEIVDKDGVGVTLGWYDQATFDYMGEYVADVFGYEWNVDHTICTQPDVLLPYRAKIYAGLYIRIRYNSTGNTNVNLKANLYLHMKA